ncbi:MAG: hypothetical protein Q7U47_11760 [Paludibacter sp.]|nr:hypothetical protein [Paludibacter sp.]
MQINHLQHKEIDFNRWDQCISQSINQLTYATSWYLNIVCPGWEALVADDYEFVMPIPVKRKYYFPYIVQPYFTQQLGIFSKNRVTEEILHHFIKKIPYYSYELNLNELNQHSEIEELPNFILNLNATYAQLSSGYSKNTQRNIAKAHKFNLTIAYDQDVNSFFEFYQLNATQINASQFEIIKKIIKTGKEKQIVDLLSVNNNENEMIAALCLLKTTARLTYFLPVSNNEGKNSSAMFLLVDELIRKYAGRGFLFDFEGSKIEGIARFYKGFGAENQPYFILKRFRPSFLIGKFTQK